MWERPFDYAEYTAIGAGIVIVGFLLQITIGAINWSLLSFPVNLILLLVFMGALAAAHLMRHKVYFFSCIATGKSAVVAIAYIAALTLLMGLLRQDGKLLGLGFSEMLHAWWFVMPFVWFTAILGMAAIKRTFPFHIANIPFMLNHWGLFIALLCATVGNADTQELTMETFLGKPEWRGITNSGAIVELPLAIELHQFSIEQYPAKLMIINNATGNAIPDKKPQFITTDDPHGTIAEWNIRIIKYLEYAAPVGNIKYVGWGTDGATDAALVSATNATTHRRLEGWVSCGSYMFPFRVLKIDKDYSLVMAEREPKKYVSAVRIYTKDMKIYQDTIQVNKPLNVNGWRIYQLDYNREKGRWSDMSTFKLIKDPWLPAVYAGIFMMMAGAVCLFVGKKEKT